MKKMNRKGFTIVELVIVIAVIAILAGVLIPTFSSIVTKAQDSKALQEARNEYTKYVGEFEDYKTGATPAEDVIITITAAAVGVKGQYVVVKDSQVQATVYETLDAAKKVFAQEVAKVTATAVNGSKISSVTVAQ